MGKAIGDILPLAIGVAISPVPISCSERHARAKTAPPSPSAGSPG